MPQRLHNLTGLKIGPETLHQRPRLATHIGVIAAQWSIVETSMLSILKRLTPSGSGRFSTPNYVGAMYLSVHGEGARFDMLRAVAKLSLDESGTAALEELIQLVRKRALERNKIIHAIWGTTSLHPDDLVWSDTKDFMSRSGSMARLTMGDDFDKLMGMLQKRDKKNGKTGDQRKGPAATPFESSQFFVYKEADFMGIEGRIEKLGASIKDFTAKHIDKNALLFAKFGIPPPPSAAPEKR